MSLYTRTEAMKRKLAEMRSELEADRYDLKSDGAAAYSLAAQQALSAAFTWLDHMQIEEQFREDKITKNEQP